MDDVREPEMFTVTTFTGRHEIIDCAEAEDLDAAKVTARTLWEDSVKAGTGVRTLHLRMPSGSILVYRTRPD